MKTVRSLALAALLVGPMSACGSGTDLADLSDAEAGQLLAALSSVYFPSPSAPTPTAGRVGPSLAPTTTIFQDTTQVLVTCPGGGSVNVTTTDSLSITVDVRLNPTPDTTYVSDSDYSGWTRSVAQYGGCTSGDWTFEASPGLAMTFDVDGESHSFGLQGGAFASSTSLDWNGRWQGTLGWRNGGRSGSCLFDMEMNSTTSTANGQTSYSFTQSGQLCGVAINTTTSS